MQTSEPQQSHAAFQPFYPLRGCSFRNLNLGMHLEAACLHRNYVGNPLPVKSAASQKELVGQTIAQSTKSKYNQQHVKNEINHRKSLMLTTEKFTLRGAKRELLSTKTLGTSIDTKNWLKLLLRKQAR